MANAVIYYKLNSSESTEQAIPHVNNLIEQLQIHHTIVGVFMDQSDSSTELMDLFNSPLSKIDIMYVNKEIEDEFDSTLISELSRREQFEVKLIEWT